LRAGCSSIRDLKSGQSIAKGHFAIGDGADALGLLLFGLFQIGQAQLWRRISDRVSGSFCTSTNELALNPEAGKMNL